MAFQLFLGIFRQKIRVLSVHVIIRAAGTIYSPECAQGLRRGVKGKLTELLRFTVQLGQMMGP
jgi:hypothetical protein